MDPGSERPARGRRIRHEAKKARARDRSLRPRQRSVDASRPA